MEYAGAKNMTHSKSMICEKTDQEFVCHSSNPKQDYV